MLKRFLSKELFYPFQLAEYVIYGILKQVQNDGKTTWPHDINQFPVGSLQLAVVNYPLSIIGSVSKSVSGLAII